MKEEKSKQKKKLLFNTLLVAMLVIGSIGAVFVHIGTSPEKIEPHKSSSMNTDDEASAEGMLEDPDPDDGMSWHELPLASDASPGASSSGVINIYTIDHSSAPSYNADIGEGDAYVYEHGDADGFSDGEELAGTTPFDTAFDICIEYQFTGSQAVDGGAWNISRVKAFANSTDLSISSQLMEKSTGFFSTTGTTDTDTGVVNFYLQDADGGAGSGFTIGIDETFTMDDIKVYYYG